MPQFLKRPQTNSDASSFLRKPSRATCTRCVWNEASKSCHRRDAPRHTECRGCELILHVQVSGQKFRLASQRGAALCSKLSGESGTRTTKSSARARSRSEE